jgi:uncharacterized protein YndB with AHSA1/START domain
MTQDIATAPVTVSVTVNAPVERAFEVFTTEIGSWWPAKTHSIGEEQVALIEMETRKGGRIFERLQDGTEHDWGNVTAWEPPGRVAFTWNPTLEDRPYTDVEVTFTAEGEATKVELIHRGWERLGEKGAELRAGYGPGWQYVLGDRYVSAF